MRLETVAFLISILILLPSTSSFIQIPAQDASSELSNDMKFESSYAQNVKITKPSNFDLKTPKTAVAEKYHDEVSIRDQNQNKISDYLDNWITKGWPKLDVIILYSNKLTERNIQDLIELDATIENIFWNSDMVSLRDVPIETIQIIASLPGVERVENYGISKS
jgi:hypothetical protein